MEPIAIIGMGCRFPRADGPDEFWKLLLDGVDAIREVPPDRWKADEFYDADPAALGKMITRWGGFLDDVDRFDREFFGISPREASAIDPQQRLLLEVAWEALEDAGQVIPALAGTDTGVFVGISSYDYALLQASRMEGIDAYWGTGVALSVAANRISYQLDLRGPSLAVDTACSSSLVALHTACQSLWSGQSRLAIAGGVNMVLSPAFGINLTKAGVLAPDGRCKTWDASANGYVRGEGAGIVVLKPLERALADHDRIRAVIRGGAVAQDGRTNGLMAPNGRSQEDLLRAAYRHSGVAPSEVGYVEAHGTGTFLGDMMEAQALGRVAGQDRPPERPCVIGSVKSNIGHLEAAAGIAGVIKTVLMFEHRQIPASLHVENPNPRIDFESLRLRVARAAVPWPWREGRLRAGVSSFGFAGTCAHVVLEEAPPVRSGGGRARPHKDGPILLPLSARSPESLRQAAERFLDVLTSDGDADRDLGDLAFTAGTRRAHHRHRLALVSGSRDGAAGQLRAFLADEPSTGMTSGDASRRRRRLTFVCSGQGPVWWPLDPALREEPAFLATLEECDRLVRAEAGWSLREQLWADDRASRLDEPDFCQPALFSVQVALANMWRSRGIVQDAVVGHSMGEVAAAHLSGALTLGDAVRVICQRGRVIRTVSGQGKMAVIELHADAVRDELRGLESRVSVAAVNSPTSTVISGDVAAVEEVTARLGATGVFVRILQSVDFASHSPQMEPLLGDLAGALSGLNPASPRLPMYSTVTGKVADGGALDAGYWAENIRNPVLFAAAVDALLDDGHDVFVELSPHPALLPAIAQSAQAGGREIALVPSLRRDEPPDEVMLTSLGALYTIGFEPDWTALHPEPRRPVRLPSYPWQRERCWLPSPGALPNLPGRTGGHPLLGHHLQLADVAGDHVWESAVNVEAQAILDDHRVQGIAVLPGAAWLEMARTAAAEVFGGSAGALTAVEFRRMLALDDADTATIQLRVSAADDGTSVRAYARTADDSGRQPEWTLHMTGTIAPGAPAEADLPALDLDAARARCPDSIERSGFYRALESRGLEYGPAFQAVDQLWRGEREALVAVVPPAKVASEIGSYGIHPVFFDAALQALVAAFHSDTGTGTGTDDRRPYVPLAIERVVARPPGTGKQDRLWAHARIRSASEDVPASVVGDVRLAGDDGTTVAILEGIHLRRLDGDAWMPASAALDRALYEVRWQRKERRAARKSSPSGGGWLIFADGGGVGDALAARLTEDGEQTVLVVAGDGYDESDPGRLVIRPDHGDDMRRAVGAARERMDALRGAVHLWSLDAEALRPAQQRGVVNTLHLIHALADGATTDPGTRLWLLTCGVHGMAGSSSPVSVTHAPIWGLGRVAALEHPELRPTLVDLDPALGPAAARWIVDELRADDPETQVAVRDGVRHVARLVRRAAPRDVPTDAVRPDATYLITGGLGALGLLVGRWLVEHGARHLVLLGRGDPGRGAEQELRALRGAGAEIHVARADVSDERALAQVLADAAASMPPIRGVVHAAGVLDDATLGTLDPARLLAVLEPKVAGSWNLHNLTADLPLDFFVLFSSLAGVLGSPGQGNYAAANAFLDALASMRASQGRPALSIAWGAWENTGLSVRREGTGRFVERAGFKGITPAGGAGWLGLLLGIETAQVGAGLVDWRRWAEAAPGSSLVAELLAEAGPAAVAAEAFARPGILTADALFAADPADRQGLLESYLHGAVARALELKPEELDADQPLNEIGLDSLVGVGMKSQVEVELGVSLPLAAALEGSSVRQLAAQMLADATTGTAPPRADGSEDESWEEFEIL